jgi:hypothetical protein
VDGFQHRLDTTYVWISTQEWKNHLNVLDLHTGMVGYHLYTCFDLHTLVEGSPHVFGSLHKSVWIPTQEFMDPTYMCLDPHRRGLISTQEWLDLHTIIVGSLPTQ